MIFLKTNAIVNTVCLLIYAMLLSAAPVMANDQVDLTTINRIVDEGFNRSEIPEMAAHLTDRIGARLTNSPQMREAERWTQGAFAAGVLRTCALKDSISGGVGPSNGPVFAC